MATRTIPSRLLLPVAIALLSGLLGPAGRAAGEDFRVENKIFVGTENEPRTVTTTIFHDGTVYDYLEKPAEITIFDKARKRFVLLDPARRVKTELAIDEVSGLSQNLRTWASAQSDAYLKFLGSPKFEEQRDEKTGEMVLESPWITYRVKAEAADSDEMAKQYREFCDWYAQLNTRLNPGYKQTFARMALNEALEKRNELPHEVHLTLKSRVPFQKTTVRSQHQVARHLVQSDRDRVAQTDQFLAMFQTVKFDEYQKKGP